MNEKTTEFLKVIKIFKPKMVYYWEDDDSGLFSKEKWVYKFAFERNKRNSFCIKLKSKKDVDEAFKEINKHTIIINTMLLDEIKEICTAEDYKEDC